MFEKVTSNRLNMAVANAVEKEIMDGNLKVGEKLPSETALAQTFGVSRNVVRESLCMLKETGLVNVVRGKGAFVSAPSLDTLHSNVDRLMQLSKISPAELFTVRCLLEPRACYEATAYVTDKEIQILRANINRQREALLRNDKKAHAECDCMFHRTIVDMSHNQLLGIFVGALLDPMRIHFEEVYSVANLARSAEYHERICAAFDARDAEMARDMMWEHLQYGLDAGLKTEASENDSSKI